MGNPMLKIRWSWNCIILNMGIHILVRWPSLYWDGLRAQFQYEDHISRSMHYGDVIMGAVASQITSLTIVYSTVYSGADQRKHQSSTSLAFVWGNHRRPVNSPHKGPVKRKMFPFDDVIMVLHWNLLGVLTAGLLRCLWGFRSIEKDISMNMSWGGFNIKMTSYRYRNFHFKDSSVMAVVPLTWESPYPERKMLFILRPGPGCLESTNQLVKSLWVNQLWQHGPQTIGLWIITTSLYNAGLGPVC